MSRRRIRSATPLSSAQLIDLDGFPVDLIDIELSAPPTQLVSDRAAFLLRLGKGPPAAVLKVGRGVLGAAELRTARRALAELAIHPGLDEDWLELLPRILAFDERADATVSLESYRPGTDLADVLARRPNHVEELTAAALSAIAPLHRQTATFPAVDNICLLGQWLVEPMAGLTDLCRRLDPRRVSEVDRLGAMLRRASFGRRIPVSWTHGDYTPGNVRVAGIRGPVTGIVDWGGARPGRPALIDEYLMILAVSCQVERAELGAVVSGRLRAGGLSDRERNALLAAREMGDPHIGDPERIDERVGILLAWLHCVVDSWRKCAIRPNHHIWWVTNVAAVLDAVAAWQESDI